ncbi:MAG: acetyltransferase [Saprospiraceae bacterium]|nr:acetyltransferase [Saprospiraceae bacterium]
MNWDKYLERINYHGSLETTLATLKELQETHQLNVPFENLDIHYGTEIILDIPRIFHKVVEKKRGGFCYELNGLFYELLKFLGYKVTMISARVHSRVNGYGKEYDHLVIVARIGDDDYITDVGYGEFAFHPLVIEMDIIQRDPRGEFMVDDYDEEYIRIKKIEGEGYNPEYIFTLRERTFQEFAEMCHYQQTSPQAYFTQNKLITRPIQDGRITLTDDYLKIKSGEGVHEVLISDKESFDILLFQHFNIRIENSV